MKFDFGADKDEWKRELKKWHSYFAWYPVKIDSHDWRWLERVYRKGVEGIDYSWGTPVWLWHYSVNPKVMEKA